MQKQILHLTETVDELGKKIDSLPPRLTPTASPPAPRAAPATTQQRPRPATNTPKPSQSTTPTYAQMAEKMQTKEFTEVRSKKKAQKETILMKPNPMASRLVIFALTSTPNDQKEAADRALQAINKTITNHTDIPHPPLILAHITATNNLTFTTAPQHLGISYEPYLTILEEALHDFPIASSKISQR